MRLTNYLTESRGKPVNNDFAKKFIKQNFESLKSEIYRGFSNFNKNQSDFIFIQPSKFERTSANTEYNYYTLLIDNLPSWKQYPKRSKSLICSSSSLTAEDYGKVYRVIFKEGSKIGICPDSDLWTSFKAFDRLEDLNYILHDIFISLSNTIKEPYNYGQLLSNFSIIDRFKLELFDDIRESDRDINPEHYEDGGEGELDQDEIVERSIELAEEIIDKSDYNYTLHRILANFLRSKKPFLKIIEEMLDPKNNNFELLVSGNPILNEVEVWSSGDALLIDNDVDLSALVKSVFIK